jgi:hypothetical protein
MRAVSLPSPAFHLARELILDLYPKGEENLMNALNDNIVRNSTST